MDCDSCKEVKGVTHGSVIIYPKPDSMPAAPGKGTGMAKNTKDRISEAFVDHFEAEYAIHDKKAVGILEGW